MYNGSFMFAIPITIAFQKNLPISNSYLFSFAISIPITTKKKFSLMKKLDFIKIKKANRYDGNF